MNEYKITYTTDPAVTGGEGTFTQTITDRTEAGAKKFFRERAKEMGRKFQSIELVRTDAPATKRNERDTLEIIRQLVADLGPQSYLATAFEGCFEDAEQNIEYDWGCSQKRLADAAAEKVTELEKKVQELEGKLKTAELNERDLRAAVAEAKEDASHTITALQAQILSPDDLEDVRQLLSDRADEAEEKALKAADEIVKYAEAPTSKEFQEAVRMHRIYIRDVEYTRDLLGRVVAAQAAAHAKA